MCFPPLPPAVVTHPHYVRDSQVADFGLAVKIDPTGQQTHMSNMFQVGADVPSVHIPVGGG